VYVAFGQNMAIHFQAGDSEGSLLIA
jgi:hypothetical protein